MSTGSKRPGCLWRIAVTVGLVYACLLGFVTLLIWGMPLTLQRADILMYLVVPVLITFVSRALALKWELIGGGSADCCRPVVDNYGYRN